MLHYETANKCDIGILWCQCWREFCNVSPWSNFKKKIGNGSNFYVEVSNVRNYFISFFKNDNEIPLKTLFKTTRKENIIWRGIEASPEYCNEITLSLGKHYNAFSITRFLFCTTDTSLIQLLDIVVRLTGY